MLAFHNTRVARALGIFALASVLPGMVCADACGADAIAGVSFNRDIRPILSEKCWACHGHATQEAGLRLDHFELATKAAESGDTPIVPGKPDESELIARVFATDETQMPPVDSHKELSDNEKALLRKWIAAGAIYQQHWSYLPLKRPEVPPDAPHPVDAFIKDMLAQHNLELSQPADRAILLRRLSLDLTGLPPTPAEVKAFVADQHPGAYERRVDRLLASKRFAEQQALHWLDAVRFADTRGFHSDYQYPIWPYRDYVLQAFDANLPIDQFTREQLAGDMLPDATVQQRLASAFNRLNRTSVEGGIQEKEYVAKYGADRVRTVAAVWLGQTVGCAECHDHKFDPISQRDFYALKAFFADLEYPSHSGGELVMPTPEQVEQQAKLALDRQRAQKELRVAEKLLDRSAIEQAGLAEIRRGAADWVFQRPVEVSATGGVELTVYNEELLDTELRMEGSNYQRRWPGHGVIEAHGPNPDHANYEITLRPGAGIWRQLGLEIFFEDSLPGNGYGRGNHSFFLSEVIAEAVTPVGEVKSVALSAARDDGKGVRGERYNGANAVDGTDATGWGVPEFESPGNRFLAIKLKAPLETAAEDVVRITLRQQTAERQATIARFRLALSASDFSLPTPTSLAAMIGPKTADVTAGQAPPWRVRGASEEQLAALAKAPGDRKSAERRVARNWLRWVAPSLTPSVKNFDEVLAAQDRLNEVIPVCFVSSQAAKPTDTRLLPRGNWMDDSGPIVPPAVPEYLGALPNERRATRLDLANWLISADNPLTARAFANRLWAQLFAAGLAPQLDDLGSQGGAPSHPELLDWLASELVDPQFEAASAHDWDWKHLVRVIVTSQAYQQSSFASAEQLAIDPENRWLGRQNRPQLAGETIRDQALAASGMLKERFGGPSVRPYQPEGYLSMLYYPRRGYPLSSGDDLWRRSVYTFWQRSFPHPTIMTFDGCTREESQVARASSNTPLQSLTLLNDVVFVEAARVLAERSLSESSAEPIAFAFTSVLARKPRQQELNLLKDFYERRLAEYQAEPALAAKLVAAGEHAHLGDAPPAKVAALASVARVILNLQEAITRN